MPGTWGAVRNLSCVGSDGRTTVDERAHGSGAIVGTYRWFAKRAILMRGLLTRYDWFVFTRTEVFMLCPLRLPMRLLATERRVVLVPRTAESALPLWHPRTDVYDRFALCSADSVLPYLTTIERVVTGEASSAAHAFYTRQPERMQRAALRAACVRVVYMPRTVFLCKAAEGHGMNRDISTWGNCDPRRLPTRWRPLLQGFGVCSKYSDELAEANRTCAGWVADGRVPPVRHNRAVEGGRMIVIDSRG